MWNPDQRRSRLTAVAAVAALAGGCHPAGPGPPSLDPDGVVLQQGALELPATVWEQNPRARLGGGEVHGYTFHGERDASITARMRAVPCGLLDPALSLFRPDPDGGRGPAIPWDDGSSESDCPADAVLRKTLPERGEYLLIASKGHGPGGPYRLDVTCDGEPCADPGATTLEETRISLEEAASASDTKIQKIGSHLFEHVFQVRDGLGNAMSGWPAGTSTRPNMRLVHGGPFGGPDAQSCLSCHSQGGNYEGGGAAQNIYQAGDGVFTVQAMPRNPPSLLGVGYRQIIAAAITSQLAGAIEAAIEEAKLLPKGEQLDVELCLPPPESWPCFGQVRVSQDGQVDVTGLEGVDADTSDHPIVRPFGLKGRESTIAMLVQGGFRVHFGMQAERPIENFCGASGPEEPSEATKRFHLTWGGPGPSCRDPDLDGIEREITSGQVAAMALHLAALPLPASSVRCDGDAAHPGEAVFEDVGCASCHVRSMPFQGSSFLDPLSGATLELGHDVSEVAVWSDFKRHNMGAAHRDPRDFDNYPAPVIEAAEFITPPLWDVAKTAPYMHDGRAATLEEAILAHGEAADQLAIDAALSYGELKEADPEKQQLLLDFLGSLGAGEPGADPECPK